VSHRIIRWAIAGISIAIGWTAYFFATAPTYRIALASDYETPLSHQLVRAIEIITCPALLTGKTFHWVIPLNGVIYAIVGFALGSFRAGRTRKGPN
jgi:hypothetical protein